MVQYLEVNDSNKNIEKINNSLKNNHCNIIAIYMNGCIHCKMLHPEWKKAALKISKSNKMKGIISFVNMDYMNQLNINTSSVFGFPHIVAIKNNNENIYNGSRDNISLFKWMSNICPVVKKTKKRKVKKTTRKKRKLTRRKKIV